MKLSNIIKTYLASGCLLTTTGFLVYYGLSRDITWPPVVGFGLPALVGGLRFCNRLWQLAAPAQSGRNIYLQQGGGRAVQFTANGRTSNLFLHSVPSIFGFKPNTQSVDNPMQSTGKNEFMFFEDNMSAIIYESQLYDFCKRAWRRQQRWQFGELTANQIFTRDVFLTESPRLTPSDYESMLYILRSRALLTGGRWQGKSGQLRYSPTIAVELAKKRWGNVAI